MPNFLVLKQTFLGKTVAQKELETSLGLEIEKLSNEVLTIEHLRSCELCMFEVIIGGRRLPWYLDLINWDGESGPNPEKYEIGCGEDSSVLT